MPIFGNLPEKGRRGDGLLSHSISAALPFPKEPSFAEDKPFVRLNLSGKSFGFAYVSADGLAQVFRKE